MTLTIYNVVDRAVVKYFSFTNCLHGVFWSFIRG